LEVENVAHVLADRVEVLSMAIGRRKSGGFTIAELLISAAITVVIVLLLGTMFASISSTASRANQRIDTFRDARAALQMIARDFANLVKLQPAAYFALDSDAAGTDVRKLDGLISLRNTPSTTSVAGDVCAVRYYCGWDSNARAYSLRRYFRDSGLTFQTIQSRLSGNPPSLSYADMNSLYLGSNPIDEALAAYAWNLRVVAYDGAGNIVNATTDAFGNRTTGPYTCDPNGSTNPLPAAIEVSFNAISPEAARAVIAATSGRGNAYNVWMVVDNPTPAPADQQLYQSLILPNMYQFRTRIALPN
jgi:type II secretory pathway pseudopilin PulG